MRQWVVLIGKGANEQTLLRELLDTFQPGDLVLGDSFYGTYFLLASMLEKGVDVVFEQQGARKRSTDFRKGKKLGSKDHIIPIPKPKIKPEWMSKDDYDSAPSSLAIRELAVSGKVLITTLLPPAQASKSELKALYKQRWQIELDLRNIKTTLGMETLSCKTPEMKLKEIWVYFLAYNLIRLIMAQSALLANILPRQLSFKHSLQLWVIWSQHLQVIDQENEEQLFILIAQKEIGKRPGRIEPRAAKRRPKPFSLLTKPRNEAREEIRKYGHPKKLK
jgi:Transposase DDE domain